MSYMSPAGVPDASVRRSLDRPRILLVASGDWFRLYLRQMAADGFDPVVISPHGAEFAELFPDVLFHRLPKFGRRAFIRRIRRDCGAAFTVACDDRAAEWLQLNSSPYGDGAAGEDGASPTRPTPMTPIANLRTLSSKVETLRFAAGLGLRTPQTLPVRSAGQAAAALAVIGAPAMLKKDGTSGGAGTLRVETPEEARRHYRMMIHAPDLATLWPLALERRDPLLLLEWAPLNRRQTAVQGLIVGQPANCAVLAVEGRVMAAVAVCVEEEMFENGPATRVRTLERSEITETVERVCHEMTLSGVFGFDFMIDGETGAASLLEVNIRLTPSFALPAWEGASLAALLRRHLAHPAAPDTADVPAWPAAAPGQVFVRSDLGWSPDLDESQTARRRSAP